MLRIVRPLSFVVGTSLLALTACDKPADPTPPKEPVKTPAKDPTTPTTPMTAKTESNPLCVGRPSATPEQVLDIGGKKYTQKGSTVSLDG